MLFLVPQHVDVAKHSHHAHGEAGPSAEQNVGSNVGDERRAADNHDGAFALSKIGEREQHVHNDGKDLRKNVGDIHGPIIAQGACYN